MQPGDLKAISQSCDEDAQCESGFCPEADGVCCESACDAPCMACGSKKTGGLNGSCMPVIEGTDPNDDCAGDAACLPEAGCCNDEVIPPGDTCPDVCTSCEGGTCVIACQGLEACRDETITCPEGFACRLICAGDKACQKTKVTCPATYACDIECSAADDSCRDAEIDCGSGVCSMSCSGTTSCGGSKLACGADACHASCPMGGEAPSLEGCDQACLCDPCP
jgi:hypothetical protein